MFDRLIDTLLQFLDRFLFLTVVQAWERAVVLRLGKPHRDVGPGLHWYWPLGIEQVLAASVVLDTQRLEPQSLTTADGVQVVVATVISYEVSDLRKVLLEVQGAQEVLYDTAYGSVAKAVAASTWAELQGHSVERAATKDVRAKAKDYGLDVVRVQFSDRAKVRSVRLIGLRG